MAFLHLSGADALSSRMLMQYPIIIEGGEPRAKRRQGGREYSYDGLFTGDCRESVLPQTPKTPSIYRQSGQHVTFSLVFSTKPACSYSSSTRISIAFHQTQLAPNAVLCGLHAQLKHRYRREDRPTIIHEIYTKCRRSISSFVLGCAFSSYKVKK